jgi:xanthosine utilization system XapX-like protein
MLDIFIVLIWMMVTLSLLFGSLVGLFYTLWTDIKIPLPFAVSFAGFTTGMLCISLLTTGPILMVVFAVSATCWWVILLNQHMINRG